MLEQRCLAHARPTTQHEDAAAARLQVTQQLIEDPLLLPASDQHLLHAAPRPWRALGLLPRPVVCVCTPGSFPGASGSVQRQADMNRDPDRQRAPGVTPTTTGEDVTVRSDIHPGATFPDYELTDHTGTHRRLSDLQGNNPLLLVLSRGGYCPKDRQQTLQLTTLQAELRDGVGYARIVTISTDSVAETNEYRNGTGADWTFLSDPRRTVQQDLEIQEFTDPLKNPMIPHTLVLEPGLVVHTIYNGYWYWGRPSTAELAPTCAR